MKARLIRRCEAVVRDKEDRAVAISPTTDPEKLFQLPSAAEFGSFSFYLLRSGISSLHIVHF